MRVIRIGVLECALVFLISTSGWAQPAPRTAGGLQSLAVAERGFIDALARRDSVAFQRILTADCVFSLPKLSEGPEAIAASWLPFLLDRGPTMVFTSDGVTVSGPDRGLSTGSLAIHGDTNQGPRTIPVGPVTILWRRVAGAWQVSGLNGPPTGDGRAPGDGPVTARPADRRSDVAPGAVPGSGGIGGYRFGMTKEEVSRVPDCTPYSNVSRTGGIECPFFTFEGRTMYISFLFDPRGLYRIQLWFYDGESEAAAREAIDRAIEYLTRTTGGVHIGGLPEISVTGDVILDMLRAAVPAGRITQVEVSSRAGSGTETWFARIGRHQLGYAVMLFANRR